MSNKILVAYASRMGSTAGVAEAIGKTLTEGSALVEVRPISAVHDLSPYRTVVAGNAIQAKQWRSPRLERHSRLGCRSQTYPGDMSFRAALAAPPTGWLLPAPPSPSGRRSPTP
jgi:hypothetical protein